MISVVHRRAACFASIGASVLWAVVPASASVAEDLASVLRGFRAAPAGFVRENFHRAVPLAAQPIVRESPHGYAAWAAEVFNAEELASPNVSALGAVCAADGLTNLEKYALGLDPHVAASAEMLPEAGRLDEHWFYWYRRPSDTDDVDYRVEVSTDDGASWTNLGVTQEPILANDLAQSWQAHYHASAGQVVRFRLALTLH